MKIRQTNISLPIGLLWLLAFLPACASLPALPGAQVGRLEDRRVEYALVRHVGADTVVFENGLGGKIKTWDKVIPDIAKDASVFAYNRPGYGQSDDVATPRDGQHVVNELRSLLQSQGLTPPYILVGHSLGGLYMQYFARQYPNEVKALVLVDTTPAMRFNGKDPRETWPFWLRIGFWLWASQVNEKEFKGIMPTSEAVLDLPAFTGKPVIILSAAKALPGKPGQPDSGQASDERKSVSQLYPGSKQVWVVSGHNLQQEKPEVVIAAIREAMGQH